MRAQGQNPIRVLGWEQTVREGSLSTRVAFLDEFGRVIAVDDLNVPAYLDADGPVARRVAELLDEARAGLDPDRRYAEDPRWVGEIELTFGEYLAGGLGDLAEDLELKALLDEIEGFYTDAGEGVAPPEGLVRRYVELTFARRLRSLPT